METQCFSLHLEFISPGIFLGTALSTVRFIREKALYKRAEDYGGMGAIDSYTNSMTETSA